MSSLDVSVDVVPSVNVGEDIDTFMLSADQVEMRENLGLVIGVHVQAFSELLEAISEITPVDGVIIVGNGTTFVGESGAAARTSLGLGGLATVTPTGTPGTDKFLDSNYSWQLFPGGGFDVITESSTFRTLTLPDRRKHIRCDNDNAVTVLISAQVSVPWEDSDEIRIEQAGVGQVTVQGDTGVVVNTFSSVSTAGQYALLTLKRVASDTWVVFGDATPDPQAGINVQYAHTQAVADTTWTVQHNLDTQVDTVSVWVGGQRVYASVTIIDPNSLSIEFATPTAGTAIIES